MLGRCGWQFWEWVGCCENNNIEMEIPCGNFFEVTINSNKLYSFILEINKQMQSQ